MATNHHFADSHRIKAERETWDQDVLDAIGDLIHNSATESGDDLSNMTMDELYENISLSNYHLLPAIENSEAYLSALASHFTQVSHVFDESDLYDNSVKISTELFQTYFNVSITVAQELIYLDQKDAEMDEILEQQVADGQVSARNRRRGKQNEKVVENKETN